MKRQTLLPMLISKVMHSLRYEIFKTIKGRVVLEKIQAPPLLLLEGWSASNQVFLRFCYLLMFRN